MAGSILHRKFHPDFPCFGLNKYVRFVNNKNGMDSLTLRMDTLFSLSLCVRKLTSVY